LSRILQWIAILLPPSIQLRRNMAASTSDATAYGVMVGVGETFLPAFALAVGLGEITAGVVASVPLMAGGILQLTSLWVLARVFQKSGGSSCRLRSKPYRSYRWSLPLIAALQRAPSCS
jgi:hypothetical protein